MKYISRILFTVGLVLGLTACTEDALETIGPKLPANGDMSVNITFAMPDVEAQTRSKVSGTENRVHTMQMVCFDANGLYLGIRNAEIFDAATTGVDTGKMKGTVPQGTSRIHFIANRKLTVPLNAIVGTPETEVMASEELSTIWNDADHQEVCYWGYHKEANAAAMDAWLNPTSAAGTSKVYMVRDRAKIVLTYDPTGAQVPVTKIEWLIHNGLERGYLAPTEAFWGNDSYYEQSSVAGAGYVSKAGMNPYPDGKRYSLWISADENDDDNFDVAYQSTGTYESKPQFLFDDDNEAIDDLKAILKVTYTVSGSPKTVYHVLKLNDNDKVLYNVVRNNTYYINAKLLSPDVAYYETLEKAINGNEFVNADIEVDRSITDINDEDYTLQILLPTETTSIVFNTEDTYDLDFAFRTVEDVTVSGSTDPDDFEVKWEKSQTFCTNPTLSYVPETKQFQIHTKVIDGQLSDQLQSEWIVVKHKESGLTRYIHVYVINQFKYLGNPTLKSAGNGEYVLNFKIPPTESENPNDPIYPVGLYPIDVKFTTNTLNAYGTTQGTTDYGLFGVAVEGTSKLTNSTNFETGYNTPVSSTAASNRTHWYYQQENNWWDFWFTYSIKSYEQTNNGEVNIYFEDVKNHIQYATVTDVGLFMEIKYFGKIYSMPVTQ
ncbi:MAG: hypothetical protein E7100_11115 [Bacteroidaceae bacterium]|nr:hypothetical protein [Bacteroidaceae bacterium]